MRIVPLYEKYSLESQRDRLTTSTFDENIFLCLSLWLFLFGVTIIKMNSFQQEEEEQQQKKLSKSKRF